MGTTHSSNLPPVPTNFPYMMVSLRLYCKIRVIYGTAHEINLIRQAVVNNWPSGIDRENTKFEKVHQFKLNGWPFGRGRSAAEAAAVRRVAANILHSLYNAGWRCLLSSDLSRTCDLTSWILHKNYDLLPSPQMFACVNLSSNDKFQIINFPPDMHAIFREIMDSVWTLGIQEENYIENTYQLKLRGTPWMGFGAESVECRSLLLKFISELFRHNWFLYTSCNIKCTADSLFFMHIANSSIERPLLKHVVISLNRNDRLRLINTNVHIIDAVRNSITCFWPDGIKSERDYHGSTEFKLRGTPWWSTGEEAVNARIIILKLLETMQMHGYSIVTGVDISRRLNDKSVLIFRGSQPCHAKYFCFSMSDVNKIRLIQAPVNVLNSTRQVIESHWVYGPCKQKPSYLDSWQWKLSVVTPWSDSSMNSNDGLHGKSILCILLDAFHQLHWKLVLSADVSAKYVHQENGPDYPVDVHSWYFCYQPNNNVTAHAQQGFTPQCRAPPTYAEAISKSNFY